MSTYTHKELCKILEQYGWIEIRQKGSHKQFKHPNKLNKITVPVTKVKKNIEMSILKQAGLRHLIKRRNAEPQLSRQPIISHLPSIGTPILKEEITK